MTSIEEAAPERRGIDATAACVVGRLRTIEEVIDWRPFDSFARRIHRPELGRVTGVVRLTSMGNGTHIEVTWFAAKRRDRQKVDPAVAAFLASQSDALDRLVSLVEAEERYDGVEPSAEPEPAAL